MKIGCIQPNYIPWRGYFDFIQSVDVFILLDDVQYTQRDWRNRNRIKTVSGSKWLTVPVKYATTETKINQIKIADSDWRLKHKHSLSASFDGAPFYDDAMYLWKHNSWGDSLCEVNIRLTRAICWYLGIKTPLMRASNLDRRGQKNERLIKMIKWLGGDVYLSGPAAKNYIDEKLFNAHGIEVEWKTYDYDPYPQNFGGFDGNVTVLDTIANTGELFLCETPTPLSPTLSSELPILQAQSMGLQ